MTDKIEISKHSIDFMDNLGKSMGKSARAKSRSISAMPMSSDRSLKNLEDCRKWRDENYTRNMRAIENGRCRS